jgi:hypothetical protein
MLNDAAVEIPTVIPGIVRAGGGAMPGVGSGRHRSRRLSLKKKESNRIAEVTGQPMKRLTITG